ncbi:Os02g0220050 [Oryza sativa Japonica Group]|uniref:Os02g0220050 protein n=1 Tax=Oryza sativa subsp. japonica TaxID=39947 RepID=A0A0P0VGK5_ORYSJ|nr:hypothetical protein EE612_009818 [Oryza sativa]BAS77695.1 Os02g0220050 [Oryza sativa Japonica Group]
MSTTTPPGASDCPRAEWPCPRGATGNGDGDDAENRTSSAISAGVAGWSTASGAAATMRPKSDDALAVELRSTRSFEATLSAKRSPGSPPETTTDRQLAMIMNAIEHLAAISPKCNRISELNTATQMLCCSAQVMD